MNILVTGGCGFIGSHIVDALVQKGHAVIVVDDLSNGRLQNLAESIGKVKFYKLDICSPELEEIFKKEKPEVIFHAAAHINIRNSMQDPQMDARINILGSLNLLENARKYGVKKVIYSSTGGAIYGDTEHIPTAECEELKTISHYGISKHTVEHYLFLYKHIYGLEYTVLRYANVYGPRQDPLGEAGVVSIFINNILQGKKCWINGEGRQTRDYVFVDDVVRANMLALEKTTDSRIFNIATGKETDVNELFNMIAEKMKAIVKEEIDMAHRPAVPGEVKRSCLDSSLAKKELGWSPKVDLEEGIEKTITYFSAEKL
ncbi:MAG: NAD-dependent epimerase/dehydratase family protein [Nanoarchaeota archaeon]